MSKLEKWKHNTSSKKLNAYLLFSLKNYLSKIYILCFCFFPIYLPAVLPFKDVTGLELEVKAKCIPLAVVLHPYAIFMHVPVLQGSTVKRLFTVRIELTYSLSLILL